MSEQSATNEALHTAMASAALAQVFEPSTALDMADQAHAECLHPEHTFEFAKATLRIVDAWAEEQLWDDDHSTETALLGDALRDLNEHQLETVGDVADWLAWWTLGYHAYVASGGAPEVHDELIEPTGSLEGAIEAAERVRAEGNMREARTDLRSLTDDVTDQERTT